MAQNQITGGNFQSPGGNPLSNGYLKIHLNRDCAISSGGQIGYNSVVKVPLDGSGNILGTVLIWPNDQLLPAGSKYIFRVYSSAGLLVSGPYLLTITSSPSPFIIP